MNGLDEYSHTMGSQSSSENKKKCTTKLSVKTSRYQIKDNNCFITVITENSRGFQIMKQEIMI